MAVSKPLLTEFGIHHRLESSGYQQNRVKELGFTILHLLENELRPFVPINGICMEVKYQMQEI